MIIDTIDLTEYGLGVVSLFPLAGTLTKLKGFYPSNRRAWFVTISTIFSLIVYLRVTLAFDTLNFFIPIMMSTIMAALFLAAYTGLHLGVDTTGRHRLIKTAVFLLLLFSYTAFIGSLTYTFNALKQLRTYSVVHGRVVPVGGSDGAVKKVIIYLGAKKLTIEASMGGYFCQVFPEKEFEEITGIRAEVYDATGRNITHTDTREASNVPLGRYMLLRVPSV